MKLAAALAGIFFLLAFFGCGADESVSGADTDPRFSAVSGGGGDAKPRLEPPKRPPPKKVIYRDLEVGEGPAAQRGDRVAVNYFGINYKTGEEQYERWPPLPPLVVGLGSGRVNAAWEEAIEGMRPGGRREAIIPNHLLFRTGTIIYLIDLVRIERKPLKAS